MDLGFLCILSYESFLSIMALTFAISIPIAFFISFFINLCKAFVRIAPHFNLFRYFFCLKPFLGSGSPKVVGGVFLQLRDGMVNEYIQVPLNTLLKGWNAKWFYIQNVEPSLLANIDHLAVPSANWSARPNSSEMT